MAVIKGSKFRDILTGTNAADRLYGFAGNDDLYGLKGNDRLYGGDGNDKLFGGAGNDKLYGGKGNDTFDGGAGADAFYGGLGTDTVDYSKAAAFTLQADENLFFLPILKAGTKVGVNTLSPIGSLGASWAAAGDTFDSIEKVIGTKWTDLISLTGQHTIDGGAGDDLLATETGTLYGGTGNDVLGFQGPGASSGTANGGAGDDSFYLIGAGSHVANGDAGRDSVYYFLEPGFTLTSVFNYGILNLAAGTVVGVNLNVTAAGGTSLWGAAGDTFHSIETFRGTDFSDVIDLHVKGDAFGAGGNDNIQLFAGGTADGGDGNDGFGIINGGTALGGTGDDIIYLVNAGGNAYGEAGADTIINQSNVGAIMDGGKGDDAITGGGGADKIHGGGGFDNLTGGGGADSFIFNDADLLDGIASILDFQNGVDTFDLTGVANVFTFTDLTFMQSGTSVSVNAGVGGFLVANATVAQFDATDFHFHM